MCSMLSLATPTTVSMVTDGKHVSITSFGICEKTHTHTLTSLTDDTTLGLYFGMRRLTGCPCSHTAGSSFSPRHIFG